MTQELDIEIRLSKCTSNRPPYDTMNITVEDKLSGIQFLEVELSIEQFGKLLSGGTFVDAKGEVRGLQNLGKKYEHKRGSVTMPDATYHALVKDTKFSDQKQILGDWLRANAAEEGWHINAYLGSQGSIVNSYETKSHTLNFSYYRYV